VERLGEVVVGADCEPGDAFSRRVGGGQHQNHRRLVAADEHLADRVAVKPREVAVKDDDVVGVEVEFAGGVEAVVGDVDGDALVAQPFGDVVGQRADVLDH